MCSFGFRGFALDRELEGFAGLTTSGLTCLIDLAHILEVALTRHDQPLRSWRTTVRYAAELTPLLTPELAPSARALPARLPQALPLPWWRVQRCVWDRPSSVLSVSQTLASTACPHSRVALVKAPRRPT